MRVQSFCGTVILVFGITVGVTQAGWLDDLKKVGDGVGKGISNTVDSVSKDIQKTLDSNDKPNTTASEPATVAPNNKVQNYNADNALVLTVQKELKRLGYNISVDGAYGPGTRKTIVRFQQSKNLPQTGNVSPELLQTLNTTANPTQTTQSPKTQSVLQAKSTTQEPPNIIASKKNTKGYTVENGVRVIEPFKSELFAEADRIALFAEFDQTKFQFLVINKKNKTIFITKRTRISMYQVNDNLCDYKTDSISVELKTTEANIGLSPAKFARRHCFLTISKNSDPTGIIEAIVKAGYIDFKIHPSLTSVKYDGWYRVYLRSAPPSQSTKSPSKHYPKSKTQLLAESVSSDVRNDPIFKECNVSTTTSHYDCACMANPPNDQQNLMISERIKTDLRENQIRIQRAEFGLKQAIEQGSSESQVKSARDDRDHFIAERAKIQQLTWKTYPLSYKMLDITTRGFCKNADGAKEYQTNTCKKKFLSSSYTVPEGHSVESYCGCLGQTYAKNWLKEKQAYSSKVSYQLLARSTLNCK